MKKPKKDNRPGIRVPTAKGSIRHKSDKDYRRTEFKEALKEVIKKHGKLLKRLGDD